uniref:Uncharacterized protein n=1 Tax=Rhizophora mucronata TaxID=61149 RepID=A0A2P2PPZ6_RHIMU
MFLASSNCLAPYNSIVLDFGCFSLVLLKILYCGYRL